MHPKRIARRSSSPAKLSCNAVDAVPPKARLASVFRSTASHKTLIRAMLVAPVILPAVATLPRPAHALNECGVGTTVVCQASGNPYAGGITYGTFSSPLTTDFSLSFAPGVAVQTNAATGLSVTKASSATATTTTLDTSMGSITATGGGWGIAINSPGVVDIVTGNMTVGSTPNESPSGRGISTVGFPSSPSQLTIDTRQGAIVTFGISSPAVDAGASAEINVSTGDVTTHGDISPAIRAFPNNTTNINTTAGTLTTTGQISPAIWVLAQVTGSIAITTGNISTTGAASSGIQAGSYAMPIQIDTAGG